MSSAEVMEINGHGTPAAVPDPAKADVAALNKANSEESNTTTTNGSSDSSSTSDSSSSSSSGSTSEVASPVVSPTKGKVSMAAALEEAKAKEEKGFRKDGEPDYKPRKVRKATATLICALKFTDSMLMCV